MLRQTKVQEQLLRPGTPQPLKLGIARRNKVQGGETLLQRGSVERGSVGSLQAFPLTPALSLREREKPRQRWEMFTVQ